MNRPGEAKCPTTAPLYMSEPGWKPSLRGPSRHCRKDAEWRPRQGCRQEGCRVRYVQNQCHGAAWGPGDEATPGGLSSWHVLENRATHDPLNLSQCLKTFKQKTQAEKALPEKMLKKIRKMGERAGPRRGRRKEDQAHSTVNQPTETEKGPSCLPEALQEKGAGTETEKATAAQAAGLGRTLLRAHTPVHSSQHLLSTRWVPGISPQTEPSSQRSKGRHILKESFLREDNK